MGDFPASRRPVFIILMDRRVVVPWKSKVLGVLVVLRRAAAEARGVVAASRGAGPTVLGAGGYASAPFLLSVET